MTLLFKYPTRARPVLFESTYKKWRSLLSGKHDVEWLISMDVDDNTMNNADITKFLDGEHNLTYCYGENKSKVSAINANIGCTSQDWQILVLISDDMIPKIQGYDDIIVSKMLEFYPECDGALHFNDGRVGSSLCTLSIMGRKLYDRFGYVYHPDYQSLWCDNEYTEVCHTFGKMTYIDQIIINHAWVDVTGSDPLHTRNEGQYHRDSRTYHTRKAAGFPKESVGAVANSHAQIQAQGRRRGQIIDRRR